MKKNKILKINGTMIEKSQLETHLEKIASSHNIINRSQKDTYPVPNMIENFKIIEETYNLLNEHLKLGINIHPAGEWLLDNFYIIEEIVKQIQKELTLKKYINFVGIDNEEYKGFARIYVLAAEIIAYTENKIESENLEDYLKSYQKKKLLSMDEIWNIGMFLQIIIIQNISQISIKIYNTQIQKYKAENIAERLIENKEKSIRIFKNCKKKDKNIFQNMQNSFIEYMSYILKRYGKKGNSYLNILEEVVEKLGTTISEITKKEHFEIANQRVLIGNSITSLKEIQRTDFLEIFEKINGVEEILKNDPSNVYSKMDYKTKEYYRTKIKEISTKTKISELYIAQKILELAQEKFEQNKNNIEAKEYHIGYYLIDKGINELYKKLDYPIKKEKNKVNIFISSIYFSTFLTSVIFSYLIGYKNIKLLILNFLIFLVPVSELIIQIEQYMLNKIVKPKVIPKLDFLNGIDEENSTFVVIPTILKNKNKVEEMFNNLEKYYIANKSRNLYFALLGDCSESSIKEEKFDEEVIKSGQEQVEKLNKKYYNEEFPIFNFIYRERKWNENEESYIGWERKRGLLNQFNEFLLNDKNPFRINTIPNTQKSKEIKKKIKYIITLDSDTDLVLNSGLELIGAMAHILNRPIVDKEKNIVVDGYGIMQPRVGINLDITNKTLFTMLFAGNGGIDSYTNAISDIYQDNFKEGIFTGKGIYDLKIFSQVLKDRIPENLVLSHDLLEGSYLRCGLVSDIMLMDGYPTKYTSFINRIARWIRGDWQIIKWLRKDSPLNKLSKYKIFDNLRRSILEIFIIMGILYSNIIKNNRLAYILALISIIPYILGLLNHLIGKKEGEEKHKTFTTQMSGIKGIFLRSIITIRMSST